MLAERVRVQRLLAGRLALAVCRARLAGTAIDHEEREGHRLRVHPFDAAVSVTQAAAVCAVIEVVPMQYAVTAECRTSCKLGRALRSRQIVTLVDPALQLVGVVADPENVAGRDLLLGLGLAVALALNDLSPDSEVDLELD